MKIVNRTVYDTRTIRTLVVRAHQLIRKHEGKLPTWRGLTVQVDYGKAGHRTRTTGHATLSGWHMHLFMPRSLSKVKTDEARRLHGQSGFVRERIWFQVPTGECAYTIYHELWHNYGYRHGHFQNASPDEVAWMVRGLPEQMPLKPVTEKPPRDLRAERATKARRMLAYWERRLKRTQNKVRFYTRRVRYYERVRPE